MSSLRDASSQNEGSSKGESIRRDVLAIASWTAVIGTFRRLRVEAMGDDITPGHMVLARLRNGPQNLRELVEREHVQAPSMTRTVNALTEQGFVTRTVRPGDGRQIQAEITPAREDVLQDAGGQCMAWLAQRVAGLTGEDRVIRSGAVPIMQRLSAK